MGWRQWWEEPTHYRWLTDYLVYRKLGSFARRVIAMVVLAMGAIPFLIMLTPVGANTAIGRAATVALAICTTGMALVWLFRWPTRRQSLVFVWICNACIAVSCLAYSGPVLSLLGSTAFAALAGYVAFLHTSRQLVFVLATALVVSLIAATRMAVHGRPFVALATLLIIAVGVMAIPISMHVLVRMLGDEAAKSHTDALTGLHNRRGFYRSTRELIKTASASPDQYLSVIMVDLDRFKQVNDTHGHTKGDRILVAVADRLRHTTRGRAVLARVGGEEFLVAEMIPLDKAKVLAERLRSEIAAIPSAATASVGVASMRRPDTTGPQTRALVEGVVDAADAAMYEAKRAGGNQVRHAERAAVGTSGRHGR
ncbi:GGDEF domain-containing protein [Mycolicibacterium agri]|uniref:GGDEF domain-containing protein n=1 Tax=Mycolicibacterium agri TaxID=36811 RepID=UPI001F348745|nr:GGDEF domain-containing protein [Mycolicibacterium agri]